jgi:type I restriction enzyme S subunit
MENSNWKETDFGRIPFNWEFQSLDDIKSDEKRSFISGPFGSNISAKFFKPTGVPVIRGNNLSLDLSTRFKDAGFVFINEDKANELNTWAKKGDIIFTAVGTIGQVGYLDGSERFDRYIISNKQIRLRVNENLILPIYSYYWFANDYIKDLIIQRNTGSSVPLINLTVLKSLPVILPPLPEQKVIASVLSSLDDKIDLLNQQNQTLEALAETLFRQWFIEEAKEGWEEVKLKTVVEIAIGRTPPRKESQWFSINNQDVKWISIKDLGSEGAFIFNTSEYLTNEAVVKFNIPIIPKDTVLLSFKMTVGRVAITTEEMLSNEAIAHFIFNDKTPFTKEYLYLFLKNYKYETLGSTSSIVTSINSAMIKDMEITIPDESTMRNFNESAYKYFNKIKENSKQIQTITQLRDTLLPKLMSGEVRVQL